MNKIRNPYHGRQTQRGMTLVEIMVAIAIGMIFVAGLLATFIEVSKAAEISEVRQQAMTNARTALELMSIDIKQARINPNFPLQHFIGIDANLGFGDGKDNDQDGNVDEELPNGIDDDGDWTGASDQHVVVVGTAERQDWIGAPDLGDLNIDEDNRFNRDVLEFRIFPDSRIATSRDEIVRFEVGTFDGESNVLVRTVTRNPGQNDEEVISEPIAFNVLGLNFLYWNPNVGDEGRPYWVVQWDAEQVPLQPDPRIEYPVSVYIAVTVWADTRPFEIYNNGEEADVLTLNTVVNIEQILKDARWQRRE